MTQGLARDLEGVNQVQIVEPSISLYHNINICPAAIYGSNDLPISGPVFEKSAKVAACRPEGHPIYKVRQKPPSGPVRTMLSPVRAGDKAAPESLMLARPTQWGQAN